MNSISSPAVAGASDSCTAFSLTSSAKSARMVPCAASFGLVAVIAGDPFVKLAVLLLLATAVFLLLTALGKPQ